MKSSIFVEFPMPWTRIRRPEESLDHMGFFRDYRAFVLLVSRMSSREMNHVFFCTIPVIRYGRRHEMKYQKESVKKPTQKSASCHFLGLSMESTALLMFRKATHIIQHSFALLSYQVCLTGLFYIPEQSHSTVYASTSTWTMHVHIMQADPLNVFTQKRTTEYRTRPTARTWHQVTSSSSVISSENSPNTASMTPRA
jgi:hypothetical protein